MGFLLFFLTISSLVVTPLHFLGWRSALKLCACAVCGFLIFGQLHPASSDARLFAGLGAVVFIVGFAGSSLVRGGLSGLHLLCGEDGPCPGGTKELPGAAELAAGLFISAALTFLVFVALSWSMQSASYPLLMHLVLAVPGALLVWAWWALNWRKPTEADGLRQACLGCGLALLLLTSCSWFWYPSTVQAAVKDTVGNTPFCLWNSDTRKAAKSWDAFTFLTAPKRESRSHFLLVSASGDKWQWSYHESGFIPYARDDGAAWFNANCADAPDLNAAP
ncbi:MAG: hypothetical protein AAFY05_24910 [Pseudomonadota bacterium]